MTRDQALALYHPIRASVRRILSAAVPVCNQSDLMRAAKRLGVWADGKIVLSEIDQAAEMLSDIALFEPNQRGRRAFDVFLADRRAATRCHRLRTGLADGEGVLFTFPLHRAARDRGCMARRSPRRQPKPLAHGRKPGGVRAHGGRFRHAHFRCWPIPRWVWRRRTVG